MIKHNLKLVKDMKNKKPYKQKSNKEKLNLTNTKGKLDSYIIAQILNLNYNIEKWTHKNNEK